MAARPPLIPMFINRNKSKTTMHNSSQVTCCCCTYKFQINAAPKLFQSSDCRIPCILPCEHSACDRCIFNKGIRMDSTLECNICKEKCLLTADQKSNIRNQSDVKNVLLVNYCLLGLMYFNSMNNHESSSSHSLELTKTFTKYEHKHISKSVSCGHCKMIASCACRECCVSMCDSCFTNVHAFEFFKHHSKLSLTQAKFLILKCSKHKEKALNLHCNECSKYVCGECVAQTACKEHTLTPAQDDCDIPSLMEKLKIFLRNIRLAKTTAKDELSLLEFGTCDAQFVNMKNVINQYFMKEHSTLLRVETELMTQLDDFNYKNKIDLNNIIEDIDDKIRSTTEILQMLSSYSANVELNMDMLILYTDTAINSPCHLMKETKSLWNPEINDNFCMKDKLREKCNMQECITHSFKLVPSSELPQDMDMAQIKTELDAVSSRNSSATDLLEVDNVEHERNSDASEKMLIKNCLHKSTLRLNGTVHKVKVTHIINPWDFYVRPCDNDQILKDITQFFQDNEPAVCENWFIVEGNAYVTRNELDTWCRVLVTSFVNDDCKINYIDYGHEDVVKCSEIHIMHPQYMSVPPMALKCRLMVRPNGKFTKEDVNLMKNIIDSTKDTYVYILNKLYSNYEVDLYTYPESHYENPVSVTQALMFHSKMTCVAKMTNPNIIKLLGLKDRKYSQYESVEINKPVKICHVLSGQYFYIRKADPDSYEILSKELNDFYNNTANRQTVFLFPNGLRVACYFKELKWCRCIILDAKNSENILVFLFDIGIKRYVEMKNISKLHEKFYKPGNMAWRCSLTNEDNIFSKDAYKLLVQCSTSTAPIILTKLRKTNRNYYMVDLTCTLDDEQVSLHQLFIDREYIILLGTSLNKPTVTNPRIVHPKKVNSKITDPKIDVSTRPKTTVKLATLPLNREDVKIVAFNNPSNVYIRLLKDKGEHRPIINTINNILKSSIPEVSEEWKVSDQCVLKYSDNWCRAKITEINHESGDVEVFLSDFLKVVTVKVEALHKVTSDISKLRPTAIKCHLSGIVPALGSTWPNITCEFFQDLIKRNEKFYITVDKPAEYGVEESLPIKLWTEIVVLGGALEPTVREWKMINNMIVEQGLAIRDHATVTENTNIIQYIKEESHACAASVVEERPLITQWLPALKPQKKEFVAIITHIDDDLNVYVMIPDMNMEALKYINTTVQKTFSKSSSSSEDKFWYLGQPCIAQWNLNNEYYRGIVEELSPDSTKIKVKFVDYGNVQECDISQLRKNVINQNIPIQVTMVKLIGVKPKNNEKTWDTSIVDTMHKYAVENESLVTVKGVGDDGSIWARIVVNGHDMAKYMISLDFAEADQIPKLRPYIIVEQQYDADPDIIVDSVQDVDTSNID